MKPFNHLHVHSQYSILDGQASVKALVEKAHSDGMKALALTDHGTMFGIKEFWNACRGENFGKPNISKEEWYKVKPILGCETYVAQRGIQNKSGKEDRSGHHLILLAKNHQGYKNLLKMISIASNEGFYYKPRIDKTILEKYREGIIVTSACLGGEVPQKIMNDDIDGARETINWYKNVFGEDYYLELQRHPAEAIREREGVYDYQVSVNKVIQELSAELGVKMIAANDVHFTNETDADAHDILICLNTGKNYEEQNRMRYTKQEWFKTTEEMNRLFADIPEALENTQEVADKIEVYELDSAPIMPEFPIPSTFASWESYQEKYTEEDLREEFERYDKMGSFENILRIKYEADYLAHIVYEGAAIRYGEGFDKEKERIDFELDTIRQMGFPGYFLIVADFIQAARDMGVIVGPGRGSAAGSAVAYCIKITNVDPIKYDLLFERFLNPDRISMPDIDIDFDDEGRGRVMDYVINKYGANQVAQIITYGTMAAKSSIRDTARVLDLPLNDADRIAKLIPTMSKLGKIFGKSEAELKKKFRAEDLEKVNELLNISEEEGLEAQTINMARTLEGSVRNTGIHACGVIITPDDITNFVPVATAKDSELYVTQFDNSVVESAGLLKMDFLGLKTLTLIKDTVKIVKAKHGIDLVPDDFPLDDEKTYELFQRGDTVGIFQYESPGMQKHMKDLKPTVFDDLIAMNALYRPGPMEYIPKFIARKHGNEEITYDLPDMEEYLKETYGITVYQEQVMLLSQKLANFSKGDADMLRKAMGKKIFALLQKLKPQFLEGGQANGHPKDILEKIWKDWEAFAAYAFNKSHSTCYAYIAYQTAYLKAHYPAEYMAAVLSNNMNDIKQVTFFMEECKRMGLEVLGPDVNESYYKFAVNKDGAVRFGMGAVKGVGRSAVETIVENRKKDGHFHSVFDLAKRVDLRAANKKAFENLAVAGGFDSFGGTHRAQYFHQEGDGVTFLEKVIKSAAKYQENKNSSQMDMFGGMSEAEIPEPVVPPCEEWGTMEKLRREKEVVGIYISGHPLDDFKTEINAFCNTSISHLNHLEKYVNRELTLAGVITDVQHRISKNGKGWAAFTMEDYTESFEFRIFGEEYLKFRHFLMINSFVHLRIYVREGWVSRDTGKKGEPRMQFNGFAQLQDVMENSAKKLTIKLDIDRLQEQRIHTLKETLASHKGNHPLNFVIYEMEEEIKLKLSSRKQKVQITSALLHQLEEQEVHYKLN